MSDGETYVLDANIFIEAQQKYYAFDICPGFWTELVRLHSNKRLCSLDRVFAEIEVGNDGLTEWSRLQKPNAFFKGTADAAVANQFAEIVSWVQAEPQFLPEAKAAFATVADGWVIAYAKVNKHIVVTHEVFDPEVKRRIPMPNICVEFKVEYCNTFDMLRKLAVCFASRKRKGPRNS